jgi:DNA-3-methyladenine glycosylase II
MRVAMAVAKQTTLVLPAARPFDFARTVDVLGEFAPGGDAVARRNAVLTGGFAPEPFVAELRADGSDLVRARVEWLDDPGDGSAVAARLDDFLALSCDLDPLYDAAAGDPAFSRVVDGLRGYHPARFPSPFAAACWAALSRRTPPPVAAGLSRALAAELGRAVSVDGDEVYLAPTPGRVSTSPDAVRAVLGDHGSARTLLAAAEAFARGDLASLPTDDLLTRLRGVWGFGPWSAEFVALRGFGRTSVLPSRERRLREAVAEAYGLRTASDEDLHRLSRPYGDRRGTWARYLLARASAREIGV